MYVLIFRLISHTQHTHHPHPHPHPHHHHHHPGIPVSSSSTNNSLNTSAAADPSARFPFDRSPSPLPPDPFYSSGVESDHLYSVPNVHFSGASSSSSSSSRGGTGGPDPYDTAKPAKGFVEEASQCSLGEDSQCYTDVGSQCYSEGSQCHVGAGEGSPCYMLTGLHPGRCSSEGPSGAGRSADLDAYLEKFVYKDGWVPGAVSGQGPGPQRPAGSVQDSRGSLVSVQLPSNMDSQAFTWSSFDHTGGRLVLPESGE